MWSRFEGLAIEFGDRIIIGVEVSRGDSRAHMGSAGELRRREARCPVPGSLSDEVRDWP